MGTLAAAASTLLPETNFTYWDWGIIALYLSVSVVIGLLVRRYIRNMADYVAAGRGIRTALGVATISGTEMGLVTIMYSSQKGFVGGFAAFHMAVIACVVTFAVGATGFLIYKLREMKVLTIPEFYERRYGRRTRILGGIMLAFGGILNMGLFLKVGSMFIVGITGLSEHSLALPLVMTALLALVLIYTVLGGMVSVVITDYIQYVVLSFGVILAVFLAIGKLGWTNIFQTVSTEMGEKGFNPIDPASGFGVEYIMWQVFVAGLVGCALWPTAVARALAADSPKTVKKQFMWASVSYLIRFMIPYFLGISAFVYIVTQAPDLKELFFPTAQGVEAVNNLYAMPVFLGKVLPAGLIGIITAAMIAAFMSTHDSYLLCWSSVITQDIVAPWRRRKMSVKSRLKLTRILIVAIGLYILYWGLGYKGKEDIWDYMAVTGSIYFIGAFALIFCGLYWKRASSTGAVAALLSAGVSIIGLDPVQKAVTGIMGYSVEGKWATFAELAKDRGLDIGGARMTAWIGLSCIALSLIVMVVFSLLFPDRKKPDAAPVADEEGGAK